MVAKRSYPVSEVRGGGRNELLRVRVQGQRPGGATQRPTPEARGGGREDQPDVQRAIAARAQEDLEELSQVEGQEGRL